MSTIEGTHAERRARAVAAFAAAAAQAEAYLVTGWANVRYLTGFTGSNGCLLLPGAGRDTAAVLGTDGRYTLQAAQEAPGVEVFLNRATVPALVGDRARELVVAVESAHLTVAAHDELRGACRDTALTRGVVEGLRLHKDAEEIRSITRACAITDIALAAVLPRLRAGVTEREVARWLLDEMVDAGAEGAAFDAIVGAGPHSAIPHHHPTTRPLADGDLVVIDFGALVEGYHADETRTVVVGRPAAWQVEIHALVAAAQAAARVAATAGAGLRDVDAAARDLIAAAGYGEFFDHGLGHGVGLEIHEAPMIGPRAEGMLPDGSPVTVEPGVYLPGRGGVRIEDTVLVASGPSIPLTTSDRGLVSVG